MSYSDVVRQPTSPLLFALVCCACSPGKISGSESSGSGTGSSTTGGESSSGVESTSGSGTTGGSQESDTGDDEPPEEDMCPADPELLDYRSWLDGAGIAVELGISLDAWTRSCTVADHMGELTTGERIELSCLDEEQQPVTHTIELLAEVSGGLSTVPVELGQAVELQFWVSVWHAGTMTWVLRDADQGLLALHYDGPFLPSHEWAVEGEFAPPAEVLWPVSVGTNLDVCALICEPVSDPGAGNFVPSGGCCEKETALLLDVGAGPVEILNRSAAPLPGGAHGIVGLATYFDQSDPNCVVGDISEEWYQFTVVAQ